MNSPTVALTAPVESFNHLHIARGINRAASPESREVSEVMHTLVAGELAGSPGFYQIIISVRSKADNQVLVLSNVMPLGLLRDLEQRGA